MDKSIAVVCASFFFAMTEPCLAVQQVALPTATQCSNVQGTDCLSAVAQALELILQRYYEAARSSIQGQVAKEGGSAEDLRQAIRSLEHAQASWRAYRDVHCDMVAYLFMNGSGKTDGGLTCTIDLTRLRIHELWETGGFQPRSLPEPK